MRSSKLHDEEKIDETWLIPYADILTLLLALFVVLAATSQLDNDKFQRLSLSFNEALSGGISVLDNSQVIDSPAIATTNNRDQAPPAEAAADGEEALTEEEKRFREETAVLEQLQEQLNLYIEEHQLSTELHTKLNYEELKIEIQDSALFASGSAAVTGSARNIALSIGRMLEQYPEFEIVVSGHTDNKPINNAQFRSNWDLSAARALNFMKVLLENKNLDPTRFSTIGYGEYRPIADNTTVEGRAQNRRVEVSILRRFPQPPPNDDAAGS